MKLGLQLDECASELLFSICEQTIQVAKFADHADYADWSELSAWSTGAEDSCATFRLVGR